MKTDLISKLFAALLALVTVLALFPAGALTTLASGVEKVDFAIVEKWGVYFEQTGSGKNYPITLTNESKLSMPLPTLYRTDSDDYVFNGWYIADTNIRVTTDTVFDGYTVVVDRWTYQEADEDRLVKAVTVHNAALEAGMTPAAYNAASAGASAAASGIAASSAKNYTIYHGLNKSGKPLAEHEEIEIGKDYSVVTTVRLADGYAFDENVTFVSDAGLCAGERFLGGADLYTRDWNTLANAVEITINFRNTDHYFAQQPENRKIENYAEFNFYYLLSEAQGLESVSLQQEIDGIWVLFNTLGTSAEGYAKVSPYKDTSKVFRLVAAYDNGSVYSEPFTVT